MTPRLFSLALALSLTTTAFLGCVDSDAPGDDVASAELTTPTAAAGCTTNLVPPMTGPSTPGGMVTRSGDYSGSYPAWKAFDASPSSMWISAVNQTPAWIGYQFGDGA